MSTLKEVASSGTAKREITFSFIIPFHKDLSQLKRCLEAVRAASSTAEIIVVADGALDDGRYVAYRSRARYVEIKGPSGPAVARNQGGALATGEILVFVDADVEVSDDALDRLVESLDAHPDASAVFGAYDESPAEQNFVSQYKNLAHSYVHQSSHRDAKSFWAGIGAVRAEAFRAVGGFDERFERPSIEDIDLGYRLSQKGRRIILNPDIRGSHLKRWDLGSLIKTDVRDRAIPWTQLILRSSLFQNDLNLRWTDRASVAIAYAVLLSVVLALAISSMFALVGLGLIALFLVLNRGFYRFFVKKRGVGFAIRVVPLHLVHYLCSGFSFLVGSGIYVLGHTTAAEPPGTIPANDWKAESVSPIRSTARPKFAAPSYTYGPARSPGVPGGTASPTADATALKGARQA